MSQMSALRAFRKPEVSISLNEDMVQLGDAQQSFSSRSLRLYTGDEREPLPLALHHTPLSVTLGLFRLRAAVTSAAGADPAGSEIAAQPRGLVLVCDPLRAEELAMDGQITFSVNSHRCVI